MLKAQREWLLVSAMTLGGFALQARAQPAAAVVEDLQIDLWPEYDRPDVLVMYRIRVAPGRSLEAPIPVPIPASVGEPHAVAWRDAGGALFVAPFTRTVEGDRAMISVRLGSREGQLEFYDGLETEGARRTYRFKWPGGVPLGGLSFRVQHPAGARDVAIDPAPAREWQGEDGLTYALVELGPQEASATPAIEVSYVKDSEELTAEELPPAAAASTPASVDTAPSAGEERSQLWAAALLGVVLAITGAWAFRASRRAEAPAPRRRSGKGVYCHGCGTRADPSHAYCAECGTKLVKSERG